MTIKLNNICALSQVPGRGNSPKQIATHFVLFNECELYRKNITLNTLLNAKTCPDWSGSLAQLLIPSWLLPHFTALPNFPGSHSAARWKIVHL